MQVKYKIEKLLNWYDLNHRELPFRSTNDPYKIWISEVMLQQTQINTAIPYYNNWVKKYPTLGHVAKAKFSELLKRCEGLGYYSRCSNFHNSSKIVLDQYKGYIPRDYKKFIELPGVGEYTAAAVLSIAFNQIIPAIDGNVKRVMSRYLGLKKITPRNYMRIKNKLKSWIPSQRPGDFNQAMMDLGSIICRPIKPNCNKCPIRINCVGYLNNKPEIYPMKLVKKKFPNFIVVVGLIWRKDKFYIQKRKIGSMLGGLWEFPGGKISDNESLIIGLEKKIKNECGSEIKVNEKIGVIKHKYSHFSITMHGFNCKEKSKIVHPGKEHRWINSEQIDQFAFPKANHKLFSIIK